MSYFKSLLFSLLYCQAVLGASVESFIEKISSVDLNESVPLSSEEVASLPKANWLPICQSVQNNEVESNVVQSESNIVYLPQNVPDIVISPVRTTISTADVCEAPNGLGLKNLLKESKALLPYDRLKSIIVDAIKDPEVIRVKDLINSENVRSKVRDFIDNRHFILLRDYVCRALNLDIKYYVQFVRSLIALEKLKEPTDSGTDCKGRGGLLGLIKDLKEAIPQQKLRDLYVRLLVSDEQLVAAIRRMRSNEFRQLLHNLTNVKEFIELKEMLTQVGVPLQRVKQLIDTALGWQGNELDIENVEKI